MAKSKQKNKSELIDDLKLYVDQYANKLTVKQIKVLLTKYKPDA